VTPQNYYQILGVEQGAGDKALKEAYRKLAFEFHPDRNAGNSAAAERMKQINEAYAVLSDPHKRREYDLLLNQFGHRAQEQFRQSYSEQDIFRESDIQQIFEEMARAFGLRGFDDLFSDFHRQAGNRSHSGFRAQGFFFGGSAAAGRTHGRGGRLFGSLADKMVHKLTGIYLPRKGNDIRDKINLLPEFASNGGPYAYHHRGRDKKLVVHVPAGVKDGQVIRLAGLGQEGSNGAPPGDLYLAVHLKISWLQKMRQFLGMAS
jgi:DnaJ-class molecular chaperone